MALKDKLFQLDGNEFVLKKGQHYCKGVWMEPVIGAPMWYQETRQQCVVRTQVIVDANLELEPWREDHRWNRNLNGELARHAIRMGAANMNEKDHDFMMEQAWQRSAFNHVNNIYDLDSDGDDESSTGKEGDTSDEDEYGELSDMEDK